MQGGAEACVAIRRGSKVVEVHDGADAGCERASVLLSCGGPHLKRECPKVMDTGDHLEKQMAHRMLFHWWTKTAGSWLIKLKCYSLPPDHLHWRYRSVVR